MVITMYLFTLLQNSINRGALNCLGGGHNKKPPRLMSLINRGGQFLLTEAVSENHLAKSINRGGPVIKDRLG